MHIGGGLFDGGEAFEQPLISTSRLEREVERLAAKKQRLASKLTEELAVMAVERLRLGNRIQSVSQYR